MQVHHPPRCVLLNQRYTVSTYRHVSFFPLPQGVEVCVFVFSFLQTMQYNKNGITAHHICELMILHLTTDVQSYIRMMFFGHFNHGDTIQARPDYRPDITMPTDPVETPSSRRDRRPRRCPQRLLPPPHPQPVPCHTPRFRVTSHKFTHR